ncbi:MAG: aldo/keto reductase [Caldilineaceae bacterium]
MSKGGPLEVLQRFHEEGVIEHIGISGGPIDMLIRYMETGAFTAVETHNRYTLLNRSADRLLDVAQRLEIAVVNAALYGSGIVGQRPRRLRPLCLPGRPRLDDRAGAPDRRHLCRVRRPLPAFRATIFHTRSPRSPPPWSA